MRQWLVVGSPTKISRKTLMRKTFSLQVFCTCWYIIFSSAMLQHASNYIIWYLKCGSQKPNWKSTLVCAKKCWLSSLSICRKVLRIGVPFTFQLLLSARNLTHLVEAIYATYCMAKYVHPKTVLKMKNTDFLHLPGMDGTNIKAVYSIPTVCN